MRDGTSRAPRFPFRGQAGGIPTLAEVLRRYRGVQSIIELKLNRPELAERVDRRRPCGAGASIGSRSGRSVRGSLRAARALEPALVTGSLEGGNTTRAVSIVGADGPFGIRRTTRSRSPRRPGATRSSSPTVRPVRPRARAGGAGLDRRSRRRHAAFARVGRRRHHYRSA